MEASGLKIVDFGVRTVKSADLEIPTGQTIGLNGPSGSGKTLLLRALADLDPHQGRMWLDGVAAESMPVHLWRRQVGLLPSESAWWHDTVGPHFTQVEDAWMAQLGFAADVLMWQVSRLSSGERQRLGLLRLLMGRPKVLLLDEPTANLDAESVGRVERLLRDYNQAHQPAVLWVSHDLEQLRRNCSAILTIQEGRLMPLEGEQDLSNGKSSPAMEGK